MMSSWGMRILEYIQDLHFDQRLSIWVDHIFNSDIIDFKYVKTQDREEVIN